jgi:hypothetical protein
METPKEDKKSPENLKIISFGKGWKVLDDLTWKREI